MCLCAFIIDSERIRRSAKVNVMDLRFDGDHLTFNEADQSFLVRKMRPFNAKPISTFATKFCCFFSAVIISHLFLSRSFAAYALSYSINVKHVQLKLYSVTKSYCTATNKTHFHSLILKYVFLLICTHFERSNVTVHLNLLFNFDETKITQFRTLANRVGN